MRKIVFVAVWRGGWRVLGLDLAGEWDPQPEVASIPSKAAAAASLSGRARTA